MSNFIQQLNKVFDSRVRLGIMSLLMVKEWVPYKEIKQTLSTETEPLTDGNLASHLKRLRADDLIEDRKRFVGRKPQTDYRATPVGRKSFQSHLKGLEAMMKAMKGT